jgi:hypothetical protein
MGKNIQHLTEFHDLLNRQFEVSTEYVPRAPGELQQERKDAWGRIMYLRRQQQYVRKIEVKKTPPANDIRTS